jgi:hypothetical protein
MSHQLLNNLFTNELVNPSVYPHLNNGEWYDYTNMPSIIAPVWKNTQKHNKTTSTTPYFSPNPTTQTKTNKTKTNKTKNPLSKMKFPDIHLRPHSNNISNRSSSGSLEQENQRTTTDKARLDSLAVQWDEWDEEWDDNWGQWMSYDE